MSPTLRPLQVCTPAESPAPSACWLQCMGLPSGLGHVQVVPVPPFLLIVVKAGGSTQSRGEVHWGCSPGPSHVHVDGF